MAITRRYFSTTSNGAGDGTTWNDRAPLISGTVFSPIITGFDYTSNSLEAYVGSGTYTITNSLSTFTSGNPTTAHPCSLIACDDSGNRWVPPNSGWVCSMPDWDTTGMPFLSATSAQIVNHLGVYLEGLVIKNGNTSGRVVNTHFGVNWCIIENSGNGASVGAIGGTSYMQRNSIYKCTGTTYGTIYDSVPVCVAENIRVVGNPLASSGNRYGYGTTSNTYSTFNKLCIINTLSAFRMSSNGTGTSLFNNNVLMYNSSNSGTSDAMYNAGLRSNPGAVINAIAINFNGYGINSTGVALASNAGKIIAVNCGFRDCSSGNVFDSGNHHPHSTFNITETDEQLFVDAANLDLRIKNTSSYWGKNLGVGDEPASPSESISYRLHPLAYTGKR